jgi:short subunit fatty acids transporter
MTVHVRGVLIAVAIITVAYVAFVLAFDPYKDETAEIDWSDSMAEQSEHMDHSAHTSGSPADPALDAEVEMHVMPDGTTMDGASHEEHDMSSM